MAKVTPCKQKCFDDYAAAANSGTGFQPDIEQQRQRCLEACDTEYVEKGAQEEQDKKAGKTGGCGPRLSGDVYNGCACGRKYGANSQSDCIAGYVFINKTGAGEKHFPEYTGQCECQKWCMDIGFASDCMTNTGKGGGGKTAETFNWGGDVQDLIKRLYGRAGYLLDNPTGMTDAEREQVYGLASEGIKRGEKSRLVANKDSLGRIGMLGSGFEVTEADKVRRGTEEDLSRVRREIATDEAQKRYERLLGTTGMSGNILTTLMGGESAVESLNAARRGEGRSDLSFMLQLLQMLYGNSNSANNLYAQALLNAQG